VPVTAAEAAATTLENFLGMRRVRLLPPDKQRRNAAERAVCMLKNHLIAGFCSLDENFLLSCWDKTLPHALMAIKLLHGSNCLLPPKANGGIATSTTNQHPC
jgi:hypothetical protein